jgi:TolB-like protein
MPMLPQKHSRHRMTQLRADVAWCIGLLCGLVATGCATRTLSTARPSDAPIPASAASVAVVPFENLSHNRNAGLILTDLTTTLLYGQDRFRVIEVSQVKDADIRLRQLEVSPWEQQMGINTASAMRVGAALEVDWVLVGSVGEYGFVDGFGETANVGMTLRLVRVEDGKVGWAGSLSRRAACGAFSEESVHRLGHQVLRELLDAMIQDIPRQPLVDQEPAP